MAQGIDLSGYSNPVAAGITGVQSRIHQFLNGTPRTSPRPFDRAPPRQSALSAANVLANEPWGDQLGDKPPEITRMYCINLNGIALDKRGGKFDTVCRCIKEVQADIFSGQEHKLDTTQSNVRTIIYNTARQHWERQRIVMGTTPIPFEKTHKPGGTMMITAGALTSRVKKQVRDKWGRWVCQEFKGKDTKQLVIMSAYQPIDKGAHIGKISVAAQHVSLLLQSQDDCNKPRDAFRRDLSVCIKEYQKNGFDILLTGDFNEVFGSESDGMSKIANETGLIDMMAKHNPSTPPATYARGAKRLDYALASPAISEALVAAGYEAFDSRIPSDHRGYFFDFDTAKLFGSDTQELETRTRRILQTCNAKQVTEYIRQKHQLLLHCDAFNRSIKLSSPGHRQAFAERLDTDVLNASITAEKRIPKYDSPAWSVALTQARQYVSILTKQLTALRTGINHHNTLEIALKSIPASAEIIHTLPSTIEDCSYRLRKAKQQVQELVKVSTERRDQELQQRIQMLEQSAHLHERNTAQALRRLKKVEALKLLFRKLRYARAPNQRQGVTSIEIPFHPTDDPKACKEWQQIDIPSEVLQHIQTRNREHFGQAHGTPFTVPPLSEHLGFTGYSEYGQQMLDGTYNSADLESNVQLLIQHLEHIHEMELEESRPTITAEEFRGKLKVWSESTSTSPSGMHLGHYKALIAKHSFSSPLSDDELTPEYCLQRDELNSKQADLFELHLALINYAMERGTTYKRWQKIANSILFKDPDNIRLHRTRVIHIYEADYNLAMGVKWRSAMHNAESHQVLNEGHYGSRNRRRATDPVFIEELQLEISRATRKPVVLINYDATACYDRIIPNLGMIVSRKFGVHANVTKTNATTLEGANYHIRTEFGISEESYQHSKEHPIYGTGQGSTNSSSINLFQASVLFDCYDTKAHPATYVTPQGSHETKLGLIGFVDDNGGQTNEFQSDGSEATTARLIQNTSQNAQLWANLLQVSGGAIEMAKCSVHVIQWLFSSTGGPVLQLYEADQQKDLHITDRMTGETQTLELLSSYKAHKTLGCHKAPAGSQQEQFRQLKAKSDETTAFLWNCPLTRAEAWTYYFACYLPSVGYPLTCSSLTKAKCEDVQRKAFSIIVARCGFNRNTKRAILYGPLELGGANFRHLYVQQGVGQITEFMRHWRSYSTAGKLLRIALAWFQEQVGVSYSILSQVHPALPHLESHWITSLRQFLQDHKTSLHIDTPEIPKLQRKFDVHLMDMILTSNQFKASEIRRLNYCRLYLKASTLSDITHITGLRLDFSKLEGKPALYSSVTHGIHIHQERPSDKDWKLWRKANLIWSDANGKLFEALGSWTLNPKDQRQQHRAYYQKRGATWVDEAIWVKIGDEYTRCKMLHDQWHYKETTESREWHNLPGDLYPIEAWPRLDGEWRLTYCGNKDVQRTARTAGTFQEFINQLPEWERELLQYLELASDAYTVGVAISHGLRAVSDGSVWDNNQGAFGWTISTDQGERMARCMGPARGARLDSYRAEAYGMLSALCFLRRLAEFIGQRDEWHGILATDSQSLLDTITDRAYKLTTDEEPRPCALKDLRYLNVMDPDWDLTSSIITVAQTMAGVEMQYIKGHQDRTCEYHQLPLLAQLNVDADAMATQYQRHHGEPRPQVLLTDTAGVCLITPEGSVTKKYAHTIRYQATAPELQKHIMERYKWTQHTFQTINWLAHGSALRVRIDKRTHLTKLVHGILPTGKVLHRKDMLRNQCPACRQSMEDWQHIMRCRSPPRQTWRECTIRAIHDKCRSLSTRPAIQDALIDGVTGWLDSGDDTFELDPAKYHIDVRQLVTQQNKIGWQQIFLGRFGWKWSDMQDDFYAARREPGKTKRLTGQRWQTVIIGVVWEQWYLVWRLRNGDLHGVTETARSRAITTEAHRDLRDLYDQRNHMEPNVQELLFETLEEHLAQPTWVTQNWLAMTSAMMRASIKRARQKAITGVRSLRQYFSAR